MSTDLTPFTLIDLPWQHAEWLRQANAGLEYYEKRAVFYPFKNDFLPRCAEADGLDLQIITRHCRCGDGIFRGREHDAPECFWEVCSRCEGTGIFRVDHVILQRWRVHGLIFHQPTDRFYHPDDVITFRSTITGLVTHTGVTQKDAERALANLLRIYDPERYQRWIAHRKYLRKQLRRNRWVRWRLKAQYLWHRIIGDDEDDGVPF